MAALPTLPVFVDGPSSAAQFQQLADAVGFLMAKPAFRGRQTVAQNLANGANVPVNLDAEDFDPYGGHSTSVNTSRWTAPYPGWYWVEGGVTFAQSSTGVRTIDYAINGVGSAGSGVLWPGVSGNTSRYPGRGVLLYLADFDYVEMLALQNSGGTLATSVTGSEQPSLNVIWMRS